MKKDLIKKKKIYKNNYMKKKKKYKYIENYNLFFVKTVIIILLITYYFFINNTIKNNFLIKRPKISIILPIYNKEKYLHRSIGSILDQTFKDIEIVLVNDGSTDNSLNILQNYSKKDSRMKIVNNDKNRGLFYSRGNGILNSIGEYLMFLEPDDLLKGSDNLEYLYNETKNGKEDIIIYPHYNVNKKQNRFKCDIFHKTIYQPEIFKLSFTGYNTIRDEIIWNKLIKREIFIKVAKILEKFMIKERWIHHEDIVWSLFSHKYAQSMKCIDKVLYIYEKNSESITRNTGTFLDLENLLNKYEAYELIFNKDSEIFLFNEINSLISFISTNPYYLKTVKTNEEIRFRIIKIISYFINRFESKQLNLKNIFSFLSEISS